MELVELNKELKFDNNSPHDRFVIKEWVETVKYHQRKQYGYIWFKNKLNQMEIKEDRGKYPHSTFFFIGDEVVMEQNEKYERLWVDYIKIWVFFESEFGYNYQEVRDLIRGMVEEHFKMKSFPPKLFTPLPFVLVEDHFKNKKLTHTAIKLIQ